MASQKLKRKALRNRVKAKVRIQNIKALQSKPVLKNVDIEALKADFKKKPAKKEEVAQPVSEIPVVVEEKAPAKEKAAAKPKAKKSEVTAEVAEEKPKAKKKPAAKKETKE